MKKFRPKAKKKPSTSLIDLAHDLGNALTIIKGNADLLWLDKKNFYPAERKKLETIVMEIKVMQRLLERLAKIK